MNPQAAAEYDILFTGEHTDQEAIPKRGLQKHLRESAASLLKAGIRPGKVEQALRKENRLPTDSRKKIFNISKNIKEQTKKIIGKVDTNGKLFQWYQSHLVRRLFIVFN